MQNTQTFQDIFKGDFLRDISTMNLTFIDLMATLMLALSIGIIIFLVYRFSFQGVVYSHTFNVTLLGMTVITAVLIRAISVNVVLSLGMVGALSIVRFRSAIKDPKDIMYLFWAIAMGIACGAGLYLLAVISTLFIGLVLWTTGYMKTRKQSFLLIIRYTQDAHPSVVRILEKMKYSVKARVATGNTLEMTAEMRLGAKDNQTGIIAAFSAIDGMEHATLVEYNGDYAE